MRLTAFLGARLSEEEEEEEEEATWPHLLAGELPANAWSSTASSPTARPVA